MPWIDPPKPPPHECRLPRDYTEDDAGRRWECPKCSTIWRLGGDRAFPDMEPLSWALESQDMRMKWAELAQAAGQEVNEPE